MSCGLCNQNVSGSSPLTKNCDIREVSPVLPEGEDWLTPVYSRHRAHSRTERDGGWYTAVLYCSSPPPHRKKL